MAQVVDLFQLANATPFALNDALKAIVTLADLHPKLIAAYNDLESTEF
jgi:hypothetical protein